MSISNLAAKVVNIYVTTKRIAIKMQYLRIFLRFVAFLCIVGACVNMIITVC